MESSSVEVIDGSVSVDATPHSDGAAAHWATRLEDSLEQSLRFVLAKSAVGLQHAGGRAVDPFETAIVFGTKYGARGWCSGLTILTALLNQLPDFDEQGCERALYDAVTDDQPRRRKIPVFDHKAIVQPLKTFFTPLLF